MAHLPEESKFDEGVYQLEMTDPVVGGPNGISNSPLRNLANRTRWLKDQLATALTNKADRESPQLTGEPTTTAPGESDNSTRIASTGWVRSLVTRLAAPIAHVGSRGSAHAEATTDEAGFMSAADKAKLNGIAAGAQGNTVTSVAGKTGAVTLAVGDVSGALASSHAGAGGNAHALATTSQAGFMSAADKTKLDSVSAGAGAGAVTSVAGRTGAVTLSVSDVSGALSSSHAGSRGSDVHGVATRSTSGFMSAADKQKLDGIETGAQRNTVSAVTSVAGKTGAVTLSVSDVSGAAPKTNASFSGTTNFSGTVIFDPNGDARGRTWPATDNSVSLATTAWVRNAMKDIADKAGLDWSWHGGRGTGNGYFKFPSWLGGLIIQSRKVDLGGYHSYPIAFPNTVLAVVGCTRVGSAYRFGVSEHSTAQFRIEFLENAHNGVSAHILAIGR